MKLHFDKSFAPAFKEPQRYMRRRKPISEGNFLTKKVHGVLGQSPKVLDKFIFNSKYPRFQSFRKQGYYKLYSINFLFHNP